MMVMWTKGVGEGRITPNQFVQMMCTNPAKIFGLYPQKGTIQPGSDADILIWDTRREFNYGIKFSQQRTDYNLYEGWKFKGIIEKVFLRGDLIVDNQVWHGKRGNGHFIKRGDYLVL
jgi:dihydropyrimidinase